MSTNLSENPVQTTAPAPATPPELEDRLLVLLDDFSPLAIQDLRQLPLPPGHPTAAAAAGTPPGHPTAAAAAGTPPGGLWDPMCLLPPEPPSAPLAWRVFFSSSADRDAAWRALIGAHPELIVSAEEVDDGDWARRSQEVLRAIAAGAFIVAPPWDVPAHVADGTSIVVIEPSRGFGTGHHASTRLCLRALSDTDVQGARVLDIGTGSGVLAMAAMLTGARQVLAMDVDPEAIDSARKSAALNPRVGSIAWMVGDFRDRGWDVVTGEPFDVVLANLTGGMLIQSAARIRALMKAGGVLIVSGFDEDERPHVERALELTTRIAISEEGWVGLVLNA